MIQFNWQKKWNYVQPYLDDKEVKFWTYFGCRMLDINWTEDLGPHIIGRGVLNGKKVSNGELSWYQPWGRCHWIAPFSWVIGRKLYPQFDWGFLTSDQHTVAVGFLEEKPYIIMDILFFMIKEAKDSIAMIGNNCKKVMHPFEIFSNDTDNISEIKSIVSQPDFHFDPKKIHFL